MRDHYSVLGITDAANQAEIEEAYRKLANMFSVSEDVQLKTKIHEAYQTLSDPIKRQEYDVLRNQEKSAIQSAKQVAANQIEVHSGIFSQMTDLIFPPSLYRLVFVLDMVVYGLVALFCDYKRPIHYIALFLIAVELFKKGHLSKLLYTYLAIKGFALVVDLKDLVITVDLKYFREFVLVWEVYSFLFVATLIAKYRKIKSPFIDL